MNNKTLFIIDEPYISDLALKTLSSIHAPVYKNPFASNIKDYELNLVETFEEDAKIYSNSENAIGLVFQHLANSEIAKQVELCKNKFEFRQRLKQAYPDFYFKQMAPADFDSENDFPEKFIIKPTIGFLSMGVHKVESKDDWEKAKGALKMEIGDFKRNFPESVLSPAGFIVEELIEGEEFAINVYFDDTFTPVVLNIFKHPFAGKDDVSDRLYLTSKQIIESNLALFTEALEKIGRAFALKNFPAHIEVIKEKSGRVVPVEINPMRFAGWCTTDLAYFAYGLNVYEYFHFGKKPDWNQILEKKDDGIYYFAMAETPPAIDKSRIAFDHEALKREFSHILDYREIDHRLKPLFAIIFEKTESQDEIDKILRLKTQDFIRDYPIVYCTGNVNMI